MRRALGPEFFRPDALKVAPALLGKFLVRRVGSKEIAAMITETEAYHGVEDRASHAYRGRTERNAPMFLAGGCWYVYFIYGMYWMLNAVTGPKDEPSAVLIRGVEGFPGPGRLTKGLRITNRQNRAPIARASGLWIEDRGMQIPKSRITTSPRIGVGYAGEWAEKLFRFSILEAGGSAE